MSSESLVNCRLRSFKKIQGLPPWKPKKEKKREAGSFELEHSGIFNTGFHKYCRCECFRHTTPLV